MRDLLIASAVVVFLLMSLSAQATPIPAGEYVQTSSNEQPQCPQCELRITQMTKSIIQLEGNNPWKGFAGYSKATGKYTGMMQFTNKIDDVFSIEASLDGKILRINYKSVENPNWVMVTTYTKTK